MHSCGSVNVEVWAGFPNLPVNEGVPIFERENAVLIQISVNCGKKSLACLWERLGFLLEKLVGMCNRGFRDVKSKR